MKTLIKSFVAVITLLVPMFALAQSGPPNDLFANATVLTGTNVTVQGNNGGATLEPGEPGGNGITEVLDYSVWYQWTAPAGGVVYLSANTSQIDFFMSVAVFEGASVSTLTPAPRTPDGGISVNTGDTLRIQITSIHYPVWSGGGSPGAFSLTLTANLNVSCLTPPSGLVSWWQAEGNALDSSGSNNGTLEGGATYGAGEVGAAFSFTNGTSYVSVPDSPSLELAGDFTIELWVNFATQGNRQVLIAKDNGPGGQNKWIFQVVNGGGLEFLVVNGAAQSSLETSPLLLASNTWHHLAFTRAGSLCSFYLDGTPISTGLSTIVMPAISAPLTLGQAEGKGFMGGLEDEVAIYNRALSAAEVLDIYVAGAAGKCGPPIAPVVVTPPQSQSVYAGGTVSFNVVAGGTEPMAYQWQLNGTNLAGATGNPLTLTDVQVDQAGNYSVLVSNSAGSTNSPGARLTVLPALLPSTNDLWDISQGAVVTANSGVNSPYSDIRDMFGGEFSAQETGNTVFANNRPAGFVHYVEWHTPAPVAISSLNLFASGDGPQYNYQREFAQFVLKAKSSALVSNYDLTLYTYVVTNHPYTFIDPATYAIVSANITPVTAQYFRAEFTQYTSGTGYDGPRIIELDGFGPNPPVIAVQPQGETVNGGATVDISVTAGGGLPLSYQWQFDQSNIMATANPTATNATLVLTNVQLTQAGQYSVAVSNPYGSTNSSNAALVVNLQPPCTPPTSGLISWWAAEGNANDSFGTNDGTLVGGAGFAPGEVGQAFSFDGTTGYVDVPDSPSLNPITNLTLEAWVYPNQFGSFGPVITKAGEGLGINHGYTLEMAGSSMGFWVYIDGGWVGANLAPIPLNQWSHVAGVYDGTNVSIYVNGAPVGAPTPGSGPIVPSGNDLNIGHDPSNPSRYFSGLIDEATVYGTALSAAQIQAIYNTQITGKCPAPPVIASQPQGQTVFQGSTVSFSVSALGMRPLGYQWLVNQSNIPGATNPTLVLNNVQLGQSGNNYSVLVSNAAGSTNSASALLTVTVPLCDPPAPGLVGWWAAEGNANDSFGTHNGTLVGGTGFAPGEVGQAFSFDGATGYVDIPDSPDLNPTNAVSVEAWINPSQFPFSSPIIKKAGIGTANPVNGYALEIGGSDGVLFGVYVNGNWAIAKYAPVPLNQWSHVAGVYDGTNVSVYMNGVLVVTAVAGPGPITSSPNDLQIGHDPSNPSRYFNGSIDEASVYSTALSAAQIQAIYNAGSAGKCAAPPVIASQPQGQTVVQGSTASFTVNAYGSQPLDYQWLVNQSNIPMATNATLVLTNVQLGQSGNDYSVLVSNAEGSTNSAGALLTVTASGPCVPPPSGLVSWWAAEGNANDSFGTNNGTLVGGVTFTNGEVGQAFQFDGATGYVSIPASSSLDVGSGAGFTVEGWIDPANVSSNQPLVEWNADTADSGIGVHMWISVPFPYGGGPGSLFANLKNPANNFILYSSPGVVSNGGFQHVALTYDKPSGVATLYCNGALVVQARSPTPNYTPATTAELDLGKRTGGNPSTVGAPGTVFGGLMDEMSVYNTALSAAQIQDIYNAGSAGKCKELVITSQPQSQTVPSGANVTFSVTAFGPGPLSYQWQFDGTNLTPPGGAITTVVGDGTAGYSGDGGPATNASIYNVSALAEDAFGNLFIADTFNHRIREVSASGIITTVAGTGQQGYSGDGGVATNAQLNYPNSVAVDGSGNLFLTDCFNQRIREVGTDGIITTVAGNGTPGYSGDGGAAINASLNYPYRVSVDASGNLFIADFQNSRIREVGTNGIIATVAGNGTTGYSGDGGPATNAALNHPYDVVIDTFGNLFIADHDNSVIRKVSTNNIITTAAGNGTAGYSGDGVAATNTSLNLPAGLNVDGAGHLFIGDTANGRVREVGTDGVITTFAGNGVQGYSGDGGPATNASLASPCGIAFEPSGNLVIADHDNQRVRKVVMSSNPTLTLDNVTANNAGNYSVIVSNPYQSVTSSVAVLTVNPATCTPAPSGLVSWWAAEGNADDSFGTNNGTLVGGVTFTNGEVGQAFSFDGVSGTVVVPDSASLRLTNQLTIEAWINTLTTNGDQGIVSKLSITTGNNGYQFDLHGNQLTGAFNSPGDVTWPTHYVQTAIPIVLGTWNHVAWTYDQSAMVLYFNGQPVATNIIGPETINVTSTDLRISGADNHVYFDGSIDEASVYNTALSAAQIQAIYNAGAAGKCPAPPMIASQPQGQTMVQGGTASFNVSATGSQPLSYQWLVNQSDIPMATNATLVLTNVQLDQSGDNYSVEISNAAGSTNSANALLTVNPPPCDAPPSGLVSWWAAEGNAIDSFGTNDGTLVGGVTFTNGEAGQTFSFNGTRQYVMIPNAPGLNVSNQFTIDCWVNYSPSNTLAPAVEGIVDADFYGIEWAPGSHGFYVYMSANNGASYFQTTQANPGEMTFPAGQWHHLAATYDGTELQMYLDGQPWGNPVGAFGNVSPMQTGSFLTLGSESGRACACANRYYTGLLDEVDLFSRALSPSEIQAIYNAGAAGKCLPQIPPVITSQPASHAAVLGATTTFNVGARGTQPLSYQWKFNHGNIPPGANPTATNALLVLTNVQPTDAGTYSVLVSNPLGSSNSSDAALTLLFPPTISEQPTSQLVQVGCTFTLVSGAAGSPTLNYQWQFNGSNLPGQNGTGLTLVDIQPTNFGNYTMIASNAYGTATSAVAVVALDHLPVPGAIVIQRFPGSGVRMNTGDILASATDPDGDPLTLLDVASNSAAGGVITLSGPSIYYFPPPGLTNTDSFNYTLSDGHCGGTAAGSVLVEVRTDTNPASRAIIVPAANGSVQVIFDGMPGVNYRVQTSDSLTPPNWQDLTTLTAGQYGTYIYVDWPASNGPARYFRSVSP